MSRVNADQINSMLRHVEFIIPDGGPEDRNANSPCWPWLFALQRVVQV